MSISRTKEALILFIGDFLVFDLSLSLMLFVRYGSEIDQKLLVSHVSSFSIIFLLSVLVYFISGLYEKHTMILKKKLPGILLNTQIIIIIIAALFFYLIPYFGITPKTNLFIFLFFSFILMLVWRLKISEFIGFNKKQNALLIGSGKEVSELLAEVNHNNRYDLKFVSSINVDNMQSLDFKEEILDRIYSEEVSVVAVDLRNEKVAPIMPSLYNLLFSKIHFIEMYKIYEDIFDRVPVSLVKHSWFLENISLAPKTGYEISKRIMDVVIALPLALVSLIFYPFVAIALKLEDGGSVFSVQTRIGQNNKEIKMHKFRTMAFTDGGDWKAAGKQNYVTKVGAFLRRTRIDELPQLWDVLNGHLSLIGPRPEFGPAVQKYASEIPYYNVRHIIKPGLSGWAQMYHQNHPHHGTDFVETENKLSYDLYYVKNRSFMLDLKIALKTLKVLVMVAGK